MSENFPVIVRNDLNQEEEEVEGAEVQEENKETKQISLAGVSYSCMFQAELCVISIQQKIHEKATPQPNSFCFLLR